MDATSEGSDVEDSSPFGTLDLVLLGIMIVIVGLLIRRFMFRKKEDKVPKLHIDAS